MAVEWLETPLPCYHRGGGGCGGIAFYTRVLVDNLSDSFAASYYQRVDGRVVERSDPWPTPCGACGEPTGMAEYNQTVRTERDLFEESLRRVWNQQDAHEKAVLQPPAAPAPRGRRNACSEKRSSVGQHSAS